MLSTMLMLLAQPAAAEPGPGSAPAPRVRLETTMGTIDVVLYPDRAPETVKNFLAYVDAGSYDGTVFHRVIPGFMIQGGGFDRGYKQKPTRDPIPNEAKNGLTNDLGTIAMARTNAPHSASAQFFINVKGNDFLNAASAQDGWGYAVFGTVVSGLDVVMSIAKTPTGPGGPFPTDVPRQPVVIESATLVGK